MPLILRSKSTKVEIVFDSYLILIYVISISSRSFSCINSSSCFTVCSKYSQSFSKKLSLRISLISFPKCLEVIYPSETLTRTSFITKLRFWMTWIKFIVPVCRYRRKSYADIASRDCIDMRFMILSRFNKSRSWQEVPPPTCFKYGWGKEWYEPCARGQNRWQDF